MIVSAAVAVCSDVAADDTVRRRVDHNRLIIGQEQSVCNIGVAQGQGAAVPAVAVVSRLPLLSPLRVRPPVIAFSTTPPLV